MTKPRQTAQELLAANEALRARLAKAEETLDAIRRGGVDTPVAAGAAGEAIFTLCGADHLHGLVIETMNTGALTVNADGVILHANSRVAELVQAPCEHIVGTALRAWIIPDDLDRLTTLLLNTSVSSPQHGEIGLRRRSGDCLPVHVSITRLSAENLEGATLVVTDLSAQKRIEAALRDNEQQTHAALLQEREMRARLVRNEKLAGMGRVIAAVTHELNNPLQIIRNYLYLAEHEFAPGAAGQMYLETAASEISRISSLVAQLREVYRVPAPQTLLPVNLFVLLEEIHGLLEPELRAQQVQWRLASQLATAWADGRADELKQVFLNLIQNAMEAMRPTGGTLSVAIIPAEDPSRIGVTFRDTGPGLAPESISQLFEPFFSTKRSGLGLGLSICNEIVKRHRGEIAVASPPGQGAAFTVWLPTTRASR
jgi:PAS domain S-box-containing protein